MQRALNDPTQLNPHAIRLFSQTHGNHFVNRLIQRAPVDPDAPILNQSINESTANSYAIYEVDRKIETIEAYLEADEIEKTEVRLTGAASNLRLLNNARVAYWSEQLESINPDDNPRGYMQARNKKKEAVKARYRHKTMIALQKIKLTESIENAKEREEARQAAAMNLVETVRGLLDISPSYPDMVDTFVQQETPVADEKTRILGEAAAAIARMEFFLGSILHEGGKNWETTDKNQGEMIEAYSKNSGANWCAWFATYNYRKLTGIKKFHQASGYKVIGTFARKGETYKNYDLSEEYGGGMLGTSSKNDDSKANFKKKVELNKLTRDIADLKDDAEQKKETIDTFFEDQGFTPQAGDIMDVRSSDSTKDGNDKYANANVYSVKGKFKRASHTTLVERYDSDTKTIHTIEGNSGNRVRGKTYDLTDPAELSEIIYFARPSLATGRSDEEVAGIPTAPTEEVGIPTAPTVLAPEEITEDVLLEPLKEVNTMLQQFASQQNYIGAGGDDTAVSGLKKSNSSGPDDNSIT